VNINEEKIRDLANVSAFEDCEIITPVENLHLKALHNKNKVV